MSLRILALHRQASACQYYRSALPARILARLGHTVTHDETRVYQDWLKPAHKVPPELRPEQWLIEHLGQFDLIIVDRAITHEEWRLFAAFRHNSPGARMIVDFDDAFDIVPWWNPAQKDYNPGQQPYDAGFSHLRVAEMTTVSTEPLLEHFTPYTHAIAHVPNLIAPADWGGFPVNPERASDDALRIFYGGATGHFEDMNEARVGLEAILENPPTPLRLFCVGALPFWLYDLSKKYPGRVVRLPWIAFKDYPEVIAWGGFDLAIAPLKDDPFNDAKSNIKWLESGIQGIPLLCSDIGPYARIPDGCAVKVSNTPFQWAEGLRNMLLDPALRGRVAARAREAVLDCFTLDQGLKTWESVLDRVMARPRIETLEDTRLPAHPGPQPPAAAAPQEGTSEPPSLTLVEESRRAGHHPASTGDRHN